MSAHSAIFRVLLDGFGFSMVGFNDVWCVCVAVHSLPIAWALGHIANECLVAIGVWTLDYNRFSRPCHSQSLLPIAKKPFSLRLPMLIRALHSLLGH